MKLKKIQEQYAPQLKLLDTVLIVVLILFVGYMIVDKTYLNYKIVYVEKSLTGNYSIIHEQTTQGKIDEWVSDSVLLSYIPDT